jgi:hypothetical protein
MYRKRFNLNDNKENVKDWLEEVCENTGIGKSNKVKFAISACETLIEQIIRTNIFYNLTSHIKTPRERYAITMLLLYGFLDSLYSGDAPEYNAILLNCICILHDTIEDEIKEKIYKGLEFKWNLKKENEVERPKIIIEFLLWLINKRVEIETEKTYDQKSAKIMNVIIMTGIHLSHDSVKNKERAIDDKIYQKFNNAGSFVALDIDIISTLARLISNSSVRLDF